MHRYIFWSIQFIIIIIIYIAHNFTNKNEINGTVHTNKMFTVFFLNYTKLLKAHNI